eukprot:scaffold50924_cov16-Tisochrysis_lutea.AAC.1
MQDATHGMRSSFVRCAYQHPLCALPFARPDAWQSEQTQGRQGERRKHNPAAPEVIPFAHYIHASFHIVAMVVFSICNLLAETSLWRMVKSET